MGRLRIASNDFGPFIDRREAGRLLGWECGHMRRTGALVLSPPGGGVIVAQQVAAALAILQGWQSGHSSTCGTPNPAPSCVPCAARPRRAERHAACEALSG